jgi:hypothetical protein
MTLTAIVTGTGLRNDDGSSRARVIRRRCVIGCEVVLRRGPAGSQMTHSVAVYMGIPRMLGLLRPSYAQIGYLDAHVAAAIVARVDSEGEVRAWVKSVYAPEEKDSPRVSLTID